MSEISAAQKASLLVTSGALPSQYTQYMCPLSTLPSMVTRVPGASVGTELPRRTTIRSFVMNTQCSGETR